MLRLFQFIVRYQAFLFFILLEVLSGWLVIRNNHYQNAAFFNSSNKVAGNIHNFNNNITSYLDLQQVNNHLAIENAQLQLELSRMRNQLGQVNQTIAGNRVKINNYNFIPASVINNSTRRLNNFITIDKGQKDHIKPNMAVINNQGVVGKVKSASANFATITSILHPDVLTSALLKTTNTLCTVKWNGRDPEKAEILYVPRHVAVNVGDSVVCSGYNAVYPSGIPIGVVSKVNIKEESTFYDLEITFATRFNQLSFVFVVSNTLKSEKDSLENVIR
jgi:rod shape-determining protein MreC